MARDRALSELIDDSHWQDKGEAVSHEPPLRSLVPGGYSFSLAIKPVAVGHSLSVEITPHVGVAFGTLDRVGIRMLGLGQAGRRATKRAILQFHRSLLKCVADKKAKTEKTDHSKNDPTI